MPVRARLAASRRRLAIRLRFAGQAVGVGLVVAVLGLLWAALHWAEAREEAAPVLVAEP